MIKSFEYFASDFSSVIIQIIYHQLNFEYNVLDRLLLILCFYKDKADSGIKKNIYLVKYETKDMYKYIDKHFVQNQSRSGMSENEKFLSPFHAQYATRT